MPRILPLLAVLTALPAVTVPLAGQAPLNDANIVAIFDQANSSDIETGTLAARLGETREVRDLGQMFADAHRAVRQQGRDLAQKLGVTPVLPATDHGAADLQAVLADLKRRKGREFDRAFLAHEIAFHQAVLDAVTSTLLPATHSPELKALVERVAPAFQGHLQAARELQQKLGFVAVGQSGGH